MQLAMKLPQEANVEFMLWEFELDAKMATGDTFSNEKDFHDLDQFPDEGYHC